MLRIVVALGERIESLRWGDVELTLRRKVDEAAAAGDVRLETELRNAGSGPRGRHQRAVRCISADPKPLDETKRKRAIGDGRDVRYRHLQRIAEREQRRRSAEQREIRVREVARALWDGLDARERARWLALHGLLDGNER